jgi:hypothetical protein
LCGRLKTAVLCAHDGNGVVLSQEDPLAKVVALCVLFVTPDDCGLVQTHVCVLTTMTDYDRL